MKTVEVTIPIAGVCYATVQVDDNADDDEIFEAACEQIGERPVGEQIEHWEFHQKIVEGNVCLVEDDEWAFTVIGE